MLPSGKYVNFHRGNADCSLNEVFAIGKVNNLRHVPSSFTTRLVAQGPPTPCIGAHTPKHSSSDTLEKHNITVASLPTAYISIWGNRRDWGREISTVSWVVA